MNYILLMSKYGFTSTREIHQYISKDCYRIIRRQSGEWNLRDKEKTISAKFPKFDRDEDRLVNWGNYMFDDGSLPRYTLNKPTAICFSTNKAEMRRIFQNKGVHVPYTVFNIDTARFPCIGRPAYHHAGKGFYLLKSREDYDRLSREDKNNIDYFSEVFPKTTEYRIYFCLGKILQVKEKDITKTTIENNELTFTEWFNIIPKKEWRQKKFDRMFEDVFNVSKITKIDYGAVDIMFSKKLNTHSVCEVNTSPLLRPNTAIHFAKAFDNFFI